MRQWIAGFAAAFAALGQNALISNAQAAEIKLGLFKHDVAFLGEGLGLGAGGREAGVDVVAALYFDRPFFRNSRWAPRPYLAGAVNSGRDTDFIGGGLAWQFDFLRNYYFAPELGIAVHNGATNFTPLAQFPPEEVPAQLALRKRRIEFGSRVLFQPGLHFGVRATDRLSIELSYVHLSNGQILNGRLFGAERNNNEGLDLLGGRIAYNFGGVKPIRRRIQAR